MNSNLEWPLLLWCFPKKQYPIYCYKKESIWCIPECRVDVEKIHSKVKVITILQRSLRNLILLTKSVLVLVNNRKLFTQINRRIYISYVYLLKIATVVWLQRKTSSRHRSGTMSHHKNTSLVIVISSALFPNMFDILTWRHMAITLDMFSRFRLHCILFMRSFLKLRLLASGLIIWYLLLLLIDLL